MRFQGEARICFPSDNYLYGTVKFKLSQHQRIILHQVNTQISIPFILSSQGYGLLWNNYGLTEFNPQRIQRR